MGVLRHTLTRWLIVGALIGLGALYWWTAPADITARHGAVDGAELAVVSYTGGVAHPPGYGVYTTLGALALRLLACLPPIQALHITSHLYALLTCALLVIAVRALVPYRAHATSALAVLLALGLSRTFWQMAIVAEVYAFSTLLFVSLLTLALHWQAQLSPPRWQMIAFGHLAGVALTHHLTSLLWLGFFMVLLWRRVTRWQIYLISVGFISGLWGWVVIIWRSAQIPTINWGAVAAHPQNWLAHISGRAYTSFIDIDQLGAGWGAWLRALAYDLTLVGAIFVIFSIMIGWRGHRRWWLATIALALPLVSFTAIYTAEHTALAYRLPLLVVLVLWGGLSVARLTISHGTRLSLVVIVGGAVGLLIAHYPHVNLNETRDLRPYAEQVLAIAPAHSLIVTASDADTNALWYVQMVEGVRPDVLIVPRFAWRAGWHPHAQDRPWATWLHAQMSVRSVLARTPLPLHPTARVTRIGGWTLSHPADAQ
jgi:hypothetical protein